MPLDYDSATTSRPASKGMLWTGRVISALPVLMMLGGGIFGLLNPAQVEKGMAEHGYPAQYARGIIVTEIACAAVYLVPQTAVLGAILLTGYLGGATATHVRVGEFPQAVAPVVLGAFVWLGLFLRDARLRALIPFRN